MRKPLIAGNWKMFKTVHETVVYIKELRALRQGRARRRDRRRAAVHGAACGGRGGARQRHRRSAAQNLHWEREGAFTGEVSAAMIREAGAEYVDRRPLRAAHAVRRDRPDGQPASSRAALAAGLVPIVCIGETLEQRDANQTLAVLDRQLQARARRRHRRAAGGDGAGLRAGVGDRHRPQRHAGAGRRGARAHPQRGCGQWFGADAAEQCRVLYGGSVKPDNIAALRARSPTSTARWSAAPASMWPVRRDRDRRADRQSPAGASAGRRAGPSRRRRGEGGYTGVCGSAGSLTERSDAVLPVRLAVRPRPACC